MLILQPALLLSSSESSSKARQTGRTSLPPSLRPTFPKHLLQVQYFARQWIQSGEHGNPSARAFKITPGAQLRPPSGGGRGGSEQTSDGTWRSCSSDHSGHHCQSLQGSVTLGRSLKLSEPQPWTPESLLPLPHHKAVLPT